MVRRAATLLPALLFQACAAPELAERVEITDDGVELGTTYHVTVVARDTARVRADLAAARAECQRLGLLLSEWRDDSAIAQLNRDASRGAARVGPELRRLLGGALHVAKATRGTFDPTWRPLGKLWDEAEARGRMPSDDELADALSPIGWRKLTLRGDAVTFANPNTRIGIAGFAKGWIIDAVFDVLRKRGHRDVRVNIGGDVRMSGVAADGEAWRLSVVDPFDPGVIRRRIAVSNTSVATSGNYFRFREIDGRRIGHILDPRTGRPPAFQGSVTVLSPDAAMADALATALFVMGPEVGIRFAEAVEGVDVLYVTRSGIISTLPER